MQSPGELVTDGRFNFGTYKEAFKTVNPLDADLGPGGLLPRAVKQLRLKEWQHFALVNEDYYISLAIFNAKTMGLAQVCVYGRRDETIKFYERFAAPWTLKLPGSLFDAGAEFNGRGFSIRIFNELSAGVHRIEFDLDRKGDLPAVAGAFTCFEDLEVCEPIVVALPFTRKVGMYSHKFICPIEGRLEVDGSESRFERSESYGLIDIHKGFYPFVMKWHWATGGGHQNNGRLVGFNLTDNQVEDQESYNENCIWSDGKIHLLPPVDFSFDSRDRMLPWGIKDKNGMVDLTFTPRVIRSVDVNALIIKNRYRAPFGEFLGSIRTESGEEFMIDGDFGMCEDFYLRC